MSRPSLAAPSVVMRAVPSLALEDFERGTVRVPLGRLAGVGPGPATAAVRSLCKRQKALLFAERASLQLYMPRIGSRHTQASHRQHARRLWQSLLLLHLEEDSTPCFLNAR